MSDRNAFHDRLRGMRAPAPPPELRGRTLAIAQHALRVPPRHWSQSVYRSRPFRIAWVVSVLALTAAHVLVSIESTPTHRETTRLALPDIDGWSYVSGAGSSSARSADLRPIEDDIALWTSRFGGIPEETVR